MKFTVLLEDLSVGQITTEKNLNEWIGKSVNILLLDENGNEIIKGGKLKEILQEEEF